MAHKLALTLKFIRSVELGQYEAAKHAQTRYGELQCVVSSSTKHSAEYKLIKDLAVELMHTDVGVRIRELNKCRSSLPEEIYARRKNVISRRLKRLLPAGASNEVAVLKDSEGSYHTDSAAIANLLSQHWQQVFDQKTTNPRLRATWLERVRGRLATDLVDLRPTIGDVGKVFKHLHESAPGPDGISTGLFAKLKHLGPDIFLRVAHSMLDDETDLGDGFNQAFLCCIPKSADETTCNGHAVFTAGSTRPISIVDAANRILAAIFCASLERCVSARISEMQRGFLHGRKMMSNLLDIDEAAHTISVKSTRGGHPAF